MVNEHIEDKKLQLDTFGWLYKVCFMNEIEISEEDKEAFTEIMGMMNSLSN